MAGFFSQFLTLWRELPGLVTDGHRNLKGRTYLFLGLVLVVAVGFSAWLAEGIDLWKENARQTGALMLTSAQATDADMFDYLMDTGAGRTLVEGDVSTEGSCVTLPGGQYHGCFAAVEERRERYETRIEQYQCGTADKPQTCTRTVQEWVNAGSERAEAATAVMLGQELPYRFVPNRLQDVDVEQVRAPSGAFLRDNDRYFYESATVRYSYQVAGNSYAGTVWLDLSADGQVERLGGFWLGDDIEEVLEVHTSEPVAPNVVHWLVQILLIVAAVVGAVVLVVRDLDDGHDHGF